MKYRKAGKRMAKIEQAAFNRREASEYLGISQKTLDKLLASGRVKSQRIGKSILVAKVVLDKFLEGVEA